MTYTAQWWNQRAMQRQNYAPIARKPIAPATFTPPVVEKPATLATPATITSDIPSIAKELRRLQAGARIIDTVDNGYRLSDKGKGKVRKHVFDYLLANDYISRTFAGLYAPTFKALKAVA